MQTWESGTAVPGHDGEGLLWALCNVKDTARARSTPRRMDWLPSAWGKGNMQRPCP